MPQQGRFSLRRREFLAAGSACALAPVVFPGNDGLLALAGIDATPAVTVGYWSASAKAADLAALLEPPENVAPEAEAIPAPAGSDVVAADRIRAAWSEPSARVTVHGLRAAEGRDDFVDSALMAHFPRARVPAWVCRSAPVRSEGGGAAMTVPVSRGKLPVSLEFGRGPTALAQRLRDVLGVDAERSEPTVQSLEVPLRRGVYFVAGRTRSGALPRWNRLRCAADEEGGAPALRYRDDRPADFAYLVISVDLEGGE